MQTLLATGAVCLEEDFLPDSRSLFDNLVRSVTWDQRIKARLAASFGLPYNYSGIVWPIAPFPDLLLPLLDQVSEYLGYRPNNCLAHYYPDGDSTMGFHTDATESLVEDTGITIVSLGAERTLTFRNERDRRWLESYPLASGSLLHMCPEMQLEWKHAILADENAADGRISLTFRCMKPASA